MSHWFSEAEPCEVMETLEHRGGELIKQVYGKGFTTEEAAGRIQLTMSGNCKFGEVDPVLEPRRVWKSHLVWNRSATFFPFVF
jgi:hypothetical protein